MYRRKTQYNYSYVLIVQTFFIFYPRRRDTFSSLRNFIAKINANTFQVIDRTHFQQPPNDVCASAFTKRRCDAPHACITLKCANAPDASGAECAAVGWRREAAWGGVRSAGLPGVGPGWSTGYRAPLMPRADYFSSVITLSSPLCRSGLRGLMGTAMYNSLIISIQFDN